MNKILRLSEKRLKALEQIDKSKKSETLIISLIGRNGSLLYQLKTKLPIGWHK